MAGIMFACWVPIQHFKIVRSRELGKVFGLPKEEIDQLEGSTFKGG